MEDLIKTEFASPMITFDPLDTGYFYQSSAESSPGSFFESSPDQSPSSFDFCPSSYSPSFEQSTNQQYFMSCLESSPTGQYQMYQPQEFVFANEPLKTTASYVSNQNLLVPTTTSASMSGNVLLSGEPIKSQQVAMSELDKLFSLSEKSEDKMVMQAKIKQILFEHLSTRNSADHQSGSHSLITPPLSPNADNLLFSSNNKSPFFMKNYGPHQMVPQSMNGIKQCSQSNLIMPHHSMVKVENQMHPVNIGHAQQQHQQQIRRKTLSPYLSALEATTASNVIGGVDNMVGQSPVVAINSSPMTTNNGAQNSANKIYFETSPATNQNMAQNQSPVYGYKVDSDALPSMAILVNDTNSQTDLDPRSPVEQLEQQQQQPKKSGKGKSSKPKKGKGKASVEQQDKQEFGNGCMPKQSQKRSAHLSAEFRYRTKLNDKISKLRSLVGQKVHLSKSAVLTRSIERIIKLQKITIKLHDSNLRLQSLVAKYSGQQQMISPQSQVAEETPKKLMSIKEFTKSLNISRTSPPPPSSGLDHQQVVDINKFLEQHSLGESAEQPILDMHNLPSDSSAEVFNFDQLLDQF